MVPLYYRDNFDALCRAVVARYGDLLNRAEHSLLERWQGLQMPAQCLYVRLVSRVGPWFRERKLVYPEISDIPAALAELEMAGLVQRPQGLDVAALAPLFTVAEWRSAFTGVLEGGFSNKGAWLAAATALDWSGEEYLHCLLAATDDSLVAPLGVEVVSLLQLLFFGNRRQGMTDFVLSDLGIACYYPYSLDREQRLFSCREAVTEYQLWGELADHYWFLRDAGDQEGLEALAQQLLAASPRFETSVHRHWKLCNRLGRDLERVGALALAASLYSRSQLHPARERRARVLETGGDWKVAHAQCLDILEQPWCEEEQEAALRILPRLCRRLAQPAPASRRDHFELLDLQLPRSGNSVELAVAQHLAGTWAEVHYVENTLLNSLFGLAFWEQIFAAVPGAFHNAFQSVPADMYQQGFYHRRSHLLTARLELLARTDLAGELVSAYRRYQGYQCRWVNWHLLSETLLAQALACLPRSHLLAIWERMLFDPGENRRGFPDLLALGSKPGDYCLIEVKGPGDQLQHSQRRWLRFFAAQGIPAQVARVSWCDD
ncbi:VRR-NUC domain-containing protein [Kineobactrum sediminis]|uniref:VRR-NUC domain-containing protein n=1 Tax=Kineobactrum sediminis TaxID=1905677 RepID=UPI0013901064|nr:VRR-NUC domain-containing protein [Kineobactrum sediminis]